MRAWELFEVKNPYKLTSHDKLWVNPEKRQIIDVPIDKHHTQFAYEHPEKFGLSGNLFKGHEYPTEPDGRPELYDETVAEVMFDSGWVRVNVDKNEASIHCLELGAAAATLRVLKQRYNDIDKAYLDIGLEITSKNSTYALSNDEFGKGTLRNFMRTGTIIDR